MPDRLSPEQRSKLMSRIRRSDTAPEMAVRRTLHKLGYRFRIQWKAAPGRPDVAFPGRRKMIFVHGCFWHQHPGCKDAGEHKVRSYFWKSKFERNRARDARDLAKAQAEGWEVLTVWECETKDADLLQARLRAFVGTTRQIRSHSRPRDLAPL